MVALFFNSPLIFANGAKVLDYFPHCQAEVIESETVRRRLTNGFDQNEKIIQTKKAVEELVKQANNKGIEAIIITESGVSNTMRLKSNSRQFAIKVSADFIQLCDNDKSLSNEPTEYDAEGQPQFILSIEHKIQQTFVLNDGYEDIIRPELKSNIVSSTGNLYGLGLISTLEQTTELWGTPSFIFTIDDTHKMIAYGRSHWLYFKNNSLVQVSTGKETLNPFTYELINQIPFDERFDDLIWSFEGLVKKGDEQKDTSAYSDTQSITLIWSNYINNSQKLLGFELISHEMKDVNKGLDITHNSTPYDWAAAILTKTLDVKLLIQKSKGHIVIDKSIRRYIYDNRLFFDVKQGSVSRIVIGDPLYKISDATSSELWHFGDYYQGQTLEEALSKTPQTARATDTFTDEVHITFDEYTVILHAYDREIYQLEVQLY
jgi:hypothetical protein